MADLGVTYDGRSCRSGAYRYDLLSDALDFARLDHSGRRYPIDASNATRWIEQEKPTEA